VTVDGSPVEVSADDVKSIDVGKSTKATDGADLASAPPRRREPERTRRPRSTGTRGSSAPPRARPRPRRPRPTCSSGRTASTADW
jgi:hypothetical protein